ncbi:Os10g0208750 [Oryza sativa Japonica Group]|uniref:Os10g0208750 protein n=1 Tax=Oryza sativa subsp. japonica TaxID=39947 RepID=A0A0P0XTP2_ORYSJ|nr:Os10g0208750 [Oryza sativa Japonica Group]
MRGVVGVDGGEEELPLATAVGGVDGRGAGPWGAWTVGARPRRAAGGEDGRGAAARDRRGAAAQGREGRGGEDGRGAAARGEEPRTAARSVCRSSSPPPGSL